MIYICFSVCPAFELLLYNYDQVESMIDSLPEDCEEVYKLEKLPKPPDDPNKQPDKDKDKDKDKGKTPGNTQPAKPKGIVQ